jgi:beta-lactamase family protein
VTKRAVVVEVAAGPQRAGRRAAAMALSVALAAGDCAHGAAVTSPAGKPSPRPPPATGPDAGVPAAGPLSAGKISAYLCALSSRGHLSGSVLITRGGQSLSQFLQQNIFRPLGMAHTGTDTTGIRLGHAHGYYANGQEPMPDPISAFLADGGLYSTTADMQRWDDAVERSTLIPAALTRQMLTPHVACPPPASPGGCLFGTDLGNGYGWFIGDPPQGTLYQHVGRIDGFLSFNGIYPASDEHIIILANSESTGILSISTTLARLALASG